MIINTQILIQIEIGAVRSTKHSLVELVFDLVFNQSIVFQCIDMQRD